MKKIILLILLTSCSLNQNSTYWNANENKEILDFDKDYSFIEYKNILKKYSTQKGYPEIN